MAITISQEPKRSRDGVEVFFVAIDNGMWFEFEAGASESKVEVDVYLADNTLVNTSDIVLFFGIDDKVFFDASPYIQPYLNNDNDNTYQSAVETDSNASQGFYLKYAEYPAASPGVFTQSSTYYASKSAKQFGDTYGQNMAAYWASSSQVVLAKLLTKVKTLPYWSGFPFSLSFIDSSYVDAANITQLDNEGTELSNTDYPALTDNMIEQVNILSVNASAKKLNVSLGHTPAFTFTVKTDNTGTSNNDQFTVPTVSGRSYNCVVDWGDGNSDTITTYNDAAWTHTFAGGAGTYTVKITGTFQGWQFANGGDGQKLTTVTEWGNFKIGGQDEFNGCSNLTTITATDGSNLISSDSPLTGSMYKTFQNCTNLTTITASNWNMSVCTSLRQTFFTSPVFNDSSITGWDVSNVTDLRSFVRDNTSFNQDLNGWNTSSVVTFEACFRGATAFKQNINLWNFKAINTVQGLTGFLFQVDINDPDSTDNTTNYNKLLVKWAADAAATAMPIQAAAHGGNSHYDATSGGVDGVTAHDYLTGTATWTMFDGGTP